MNKRDITKSRTASDVEVRYKLSEITNKVEKEAGKSLSTNDFTDSYKQAVDNNTKLRHNHNNMAALNSVTTDKINFWNRDIQYTLFDGETTSDITVSLADYDLINIIYGNDTLFEVKPLIYDIDKQFTLFLINGTDITSAIYKMNENGISKVSTTSDIKIFKVIGYKFKKGSGA